jgi:hypothetical protein
MIELATIMIELAAWPHLVSFFSSEAIVVFSDIKRTDKDLICAFRRSMTSEKADFVFTLWPRAVNAISANTIKLDTTVANVTETSTQVLIKQRHPGFAA